MHMRMDAYVHAHAHLCTCACTLMHICMHTYAHAHAHLCTYACTPMHMQVVPQMDLLFATLRTAGLELLLFSLLFSVVILGFAIAFYMAFGLDVHGYRTINSALLSLFQMVLGIFDYDELYNSNRILAPILFGSFVILVQPPTPCLPPSPIIPHLSPLTPHLSLPNSHP